MGSWSRGFQAAQKSFGLVRKNKETLWYVIITCICFAAIIFSFLFFKFSEYYTVLLNTYRNQFITISGILLAIPLIYMSLQHVSIKKPRFTLTTFMWLALWILIEAAALYIMALYLPANKENLDFTYMERLIPFAWRILTYYVLSAIIIDGVDPLRAIISSIKGIQQTYIEAIGFGIYFGLVGFFVIALFLPLIGLVIYSFNSDAIIFTITNAFGLFLLLIQYVGRTLLYLYSKKELPASYFEK